MTVFVDRSTTIMSVFTGKQRSSLRVFGQSGSCEDFHATLEIQTNPPCCWARLICESRVLGERPRLMRERNGKRVRLVATSFIQNSRDQIVGARRHLKKNFSQFSQKMDRFLCIFGIFSALSEALFAVWHQSVIAGNSTLSFWRFEFILKNKKPFSFESCLPSVVHFRKGSRRKRVKEKET